MKLVKDIIFRKVAGEVLLIPTGELAKEIRGLMSLNESGIFLCNQLKEEQSEDNLISSLIEEYDISIEVAKRDVKKFLNELNENGLLVNNK